MDTVAPARRKLTVDAYYRMGEAGIFAPGERVELIDGDLIDRAPIGSDHASTVNSFTKTLILACGDRASVRIQSPVRLDDHSEPEPNFALCVPRADDYRAGHPGLAEVLLVIKVSKTSLRFDSETKLPLYARAGIQEV